MKSRSSTATTKFTMRIAAAADKIGPYCRHCEEPTGPAFGPPDDKLRDEAIHCRYAVPWIASRSLSSCAHSRDPVARNDGRIALATACRLAAVLRPDLPAAQAAPCHLRPAAKL